MAASTGPHEKGKHGVESHFAQHLAANEVRTRDRAVKKLSKWMKARSAKGSGFEKDELLKLWKGLYYCMWMSDKMLVQEDLADSLSEMIHNMCTPQQGLLFYQTFLITIGREWHGIDYLRVDKFYMLFRRVFRQALMVLQKNSWEPRLVKSFVKILSRLIFRSKQDAYPTGLRMFMVDIYIEELSRVSSDELSEEHVLWFLQPLVRLAAETKESTLADSIMTVVFEEIVNQAWLGEQEEEDNKEFEFLEEANKKAKIEGVKVFEELPMLQFDHQAISSMLLKYASKPGILSRNRKRIYKTIVLYRNLLQGVHPSQLLKPLKKDRVDRFMRIDNPQRAEMMLKAKRKSKERLKLFLKRRKERKLQRESVLAAEGTGGDEPTEGGREENVSAITNTPVDVDGEIDQQGDEEKARDSLSKESISSGETGKGTSKKRKKKTPKAGRTTNQEEDGSDIRKQVFEDQVNGEIQTGGSSSGVQMSNALAEVDEEIGQQEEEGEARQSPSKGSIPSGGTGKKRRKKTPKAGKTTNQQENSSDVREQDERNGGIQTEDSSDSKMKSILSEGKELSDKEEGEMKHDGGRSGKRDSLATVLFKDEVRLSEEEYSKGKDGSTSPQKGRKKFQRSVENAVDSAGDAKENEVGTGLGEVSEKEGGASDMMANSEKMSKRRKSTRKPAAAESIAQDDGQNSSQSEKSTGKTVTEEEKGDAVSESGKGEVKGETSSPKKEPLQRKKRNRKSDRGGDEVSTPVEVVTAIAGEITDRPEGAVSPTPTSPKREQRKKKLQGDGEEKASEMDVLPAPGNVEEISNKAVSPKKSPKRQQRKRVSQEGRVEDTSAEAEVATPELEEIGDSGREEALSKTKSSKRGRDKRKSALAEENREGGTVSQAEEEGEGKTEDLEDEAIISKTKSSKRGSRKRKSPLAEENTEGMTSGPVEVGKGLTEDLEDGVASSKTRSSKRGKNKRKSAVSEETEEGGGTTSRGEAGKTVGQEDGGMIEQKGVDEGKTPKPERASRKSTTGTTKKGKGRLESVVKEPSKDFYSPPVTRKRVKIALANNEELPSGDYKKRIRASPGIPFDKEKKPQSPAIKPTPPSPVRRSTRKKRKTVKLT